jgi:hypothetical protein
MGFYLRSFLNNLINCTIRFVNLWVTFGQSQREERATLPAERGGFRSNSLYYNHSSRPWTSDMSDRRMNCVPT